MSASYPTMNRSRVFAAYLGDIRFELVKMLRVPAFAIPTLLFPVLFFLLFGVLLGSARGNTQASTLAFAGLSVFGSIAPGLFGFGVSLAFEREQGMLIFRQAIPMPAGSYLLARMVMAMIFVAIVSLLMIGLAVTVGHVRLTFGQAAAVFFINVFGVLPFCAMGLFVGSLVSGQAAPAIVNLIYIPMAFLSGLWVPLPLLGKTLQQLAPIWPAHHLLQLALHAIGVHSVGAAVTHVGALLGVTILFFTLAVRRLGGGGIRLLGSQRAGAGVSFPLRRAINVSVLWISIGLVIAGALGGNAPQAATPNAATSKGAEESPPDDPGSTAPVGVAAPDAPLIADFDGGSAAAAFGLGFSAADDKMRGGNSSVHQQIVDAGAENSRAALEVSGEVGTAIQYPFAGTALLPNGTPGTDFAKQGYMDFSKKHNLRFFARGDGQTYTVMLMGPALDTIPSMYGFTAGEQWQEISVPLQDMGGLDLERVKLISFGTMNPGPFRFQIDGVRVE
ncbi:MAG TPA: CIA30 family protein [Steroidobacteraceae bacterium]|nr:CIA30 family protein [Steroidobacteraceae bacterium]